MEQAIQLVERWGEKLAELAAQVGPEVYTLAMTAIIVQHVGFLATGFGLLALAVAFGVAAIKMRGKRALQKAKIEERKRLEELSDDDARRMYPWKERGSDEDALHGYTALAVIFSLITLVLGTIALFDYLLNIWNWAALYDPRLIIAKRVLGI